MLSAIELHLLVCEISDQTLRCTVSSQDRITSCRQRIAGEVEQKAKTEQAVAVSLEILSRHRG